MCGIVGVLSRPPRRQPPDVGPCALGLARASRRLEDLLARPLTDPAALEAPVAEAEEVLGVLGGLPGLRALLLDAGSMEERVEVLGRLGRRLEAALDEASPGLGSGALEALSALLVRWKDLTYALAHDRLGNLGKVRRLAGDASTEAHWRAAYDVNLALNALDRLEVRGRDSAGLHLLVRGAAPIRDPDLEADLDRREGVRHFRHGAVRRLDTPGGVAWSFVYKRAAEVGVLGENVRFLREEVATDRLLFAALESESAEVEVLAHTRWASVGVVSEANAHPMNQEGERAAKELGRGPYVVSALNGDVDNYAALTRDEGLDIPREITTDAKVIPALVARYLGTASDGLEAFRRAVSRLEGSVAVASTLSGEGGCLYLALRGSGQALYAGFAEDAFLVASEPYGLVEACRTYVRLDGETSRDPALPSSRGQVLRLDRRQAGEPEGLERMSYDGVRLPIEGSDVRRLDITTRDVDRGPHRHYLEKEIAESPDSLKKTLRGRIRDADGHQSVRLGEDVLPAALLRRLAGGRIGRVRVIGQGTAAVAGRGVAELIRDALRSAPVEVVAMPATEASGFHLRDDMSDELVVAISQSGTTTDTNRTVDLLRARGAAVVAIVNRRQSDLTDKVDGVLYTSDGRDVEMSVASTKAFYSQIVAGALLAEALADALGVADVERRDRLLSALVALPEKMRALLAGAEEIAVAAASAPYRRHWAVVGNGRERVAAEEVRIKLSELCYKAIPCDATEDKKHIDLSSEPLILVCAAGVTRGTADDVRKEVEIFAAHKALPVVIAEERSGAWRGASFVLRVPETAPELAFVLSTMVGHLFAYRAALAIDALARPLREARGALEAVSAQDGGEDVRPALARALAGPGAAMEEDLAAGRYDGSLDARLVVGLMRALRYATGVIPLDRFALDFGRPGVPSGAVAVLAQLLTDGIEALTRPVDAIKHQAKTVTVGISRSEEALLAARLVRAVGAAGTPPERITWEDLRVLKALDLAVEDVRGTTRYAIEGDPESATIRIVSRTGVSEDLPSRVDHDHRLRGTKHTVAMEKRVLAAVGRHDGSTILLVPEVKDGEAVGIQLLHVTYRRSLDAATLRAVLAGYRNRYQLIRDAVVETGRRMDDEDLTLLPVEDLLCEPVLVVADRLSTVRA